MDDLPESVAKDNLFERAENCSTDGDGDGDVVMGHDDKKKPSGKNGV